MNDLQLGAQQLLADLDAMLMIAVALAASAVLWLRPLSRIARTFWQQRPGVVIFCAALAVRLIGIGDAPLSYDESFSAAIIRLSLSDIYKATAGDVHPPLYYSLLKLAAEVFGSGEVGLRMLSALTGAGAAVMVHKISRIPTAGLIAALLPGLIAFGQDARMYGLLPLLLLTAYWSASKGRWHIYRLTMAGALWTHNYAWLYLPAMAAPILLVAHRRHDWRQLAAGTVGAVIIWLPWLPGFVRQLDHVQAGFWVVAPTPARILEPVLTLVTGYGAPPIITIILAAAALLLTGAGIYAIWQQPDDNRNWRLSAVVFVLLPPALALIASVLLRPVYLPRAFIAGAFLLPWLWTVGLRNIRTDAPRYVLAAALGIGLVGAWFPAAGNPAIDARALIAAMPLEPGDTVHHTEIASYLNTAPYLPDMVDNVVFGYASDLSQTLTPETKALMRFAHYADVDSGQYVVISETPLTSEQQARENARILASMDCAEIVQQSDSIRRVTAYQCQ